MNRDYHSLLVRGCVVTLIAALTSVSAACQSAPMKRPPPPEVEAQWTRDSARYVHDSVQWEREAQVRDSISRSINTDSLYRIYRALLTTPDPALLNLMNCVAGGIDHRYGSIPGEAAIRRMEDTVWKGEERATAMRRLDSLQANMSVHERMMQSISPTKCHWGPFHDSLMAGAPVDYIRSRPPRPKRPHP